MTSSPATTPAEVSRLLRRAYPNVGGWPGALIRWRPYICPFHDLLKPVPPDSSFIDVGCGVGLMSALLAYARGARRVIGFDTSARAIETARRATMPAGAVATFHCLSERDPWPRDQVDHVVCVDVLHHVPAPEQRDFIRRLARLNWTGQLFFKDVSPRPMWMAMASRLHDLLLARQWIHIRHEDEVRGWFEEEGLSVSQPLRLHMVWYSHYYLIVGRAG